MADYVRFELNGRPQQAPVGTSVAACVFLSGQSVFRTSIKGEPRSALCGMGICFECRVTINGVPNRRSCQLEVHEGMSVETT